MTKFSQILSEAKTKEETLPDGTIRRENDDFISYRKNGEYHRIDGPALINKSLGMKLYYMNGIQHRIDGPAVIIGKYDEEYWVNGKLLTKEEFYKHFGRS